MAAASFAQSSFLGGEVSKSVQGQFDNQRYRTWMKVCLNGMPMEQSAWTRSPGSMHLGTTRNGLPGRVIGFDFKQSSPYTMEFTSGFLRFRAGPTLATSNDSQAVVAISSANPAVVQVAAAPATGKTVKFTDLGANNPLLQNRLFTITNVDGTHFSLQDAITGTNIDGSALGTFVSGNVATVLEIATPYTGSRWSSLRAIQTDIPTLNGTTPGAVLLQGSVVPYVLKVETAPTALAFATFSLAPVNFLDGPYLDPPTSGALVTPSAKTGLLNLVVSFPAYVSTTVYAIGAFVTNISVSYRSLVDQNLGNTPASSPTKWEVVNAATAIGPNGFVASDVGRHVRLFSEPALWAVGTSYINGAIVKYGNSYYTWTGTTTTATLANAPTLSTSWALNATGAVWSWGKITALLNIISGTLSGSGQIGDMTSGAGLASAFDGVIVKTSALSANHTTAGAQTQTVFIGKNYSGATAQAISLATVFPSSDLGLFSVPPFTLATPLSFKNITASVTYNLRAKASLPANSADGTLLGTATVSADVPFSRTSTNINAFITTNPINIAQPVTIQSNNKTTTWNYVWVEAIASVLAPDAYPGWSGTFTQSVSQAEFFSPAGSASAGVTIELIGGDLLYTVPIVTWRLGLYSDTTSWPICGTYHEGRLWLSGAVGNRIDGSRSNDPFNFAPTNRDGTVPPNVAISYTFNAPDVNPIFWMEPDHAGIVCGTQAGEWLVQATSQNLPLTPTTIQAHRYTKYNCANVLPARTNLTLAVVQAFRRELLEYFADVYSGRFSAHDLAFHAKHLVASGIQEIGYQQELIPTIWGRCGDGSLIGVTYGRQSLVSSQPPDASGWHRRALGSGRLVESICIGANSDGTLNSLVMVTNDQTTNLRHVEMLSNVFLETDDLADAWMLDDAVMPSSTSTSPTAVAGAPYGGLTINGLWHLNGKTVQVFAAGLDCGQGEAGTAISDFTVSNGSIFVPYGDGVSAGTGGGKFTVAFATDAVSAGQIVVGFTYDSDGQIVRPNSPSESGARNGPAFGKLRRSAQYALLVEKAAGLSIGTDFDHLDAVKFNAPGDAEPLEPGLTYSGIFRDTLSNDDDFEGAVCWRVSRPLPATICAIGMFPHTKDI